MKIVVIGNGALGDALISCICNEGHSVTVVDENVEEVNEVVNKYDVLGVCGNGASVDVQKNADVENADVVISVTAGAMGFMALRSLTTDVNITARIIKYSVAFLSAVIFRSRGVAR